MPVDGLWIVVAAGVFTAIVCGLGTLPFFLVDDIDDRTTVVLWGLAGGIMLFASLFGFVVEGLQEGTLGQVGAGLLVGVALVIVADRVIADYEFEPRDLPEADVRKLALFVGVLTLHSFPEGIALGVAFADLGVDGDLVVAGLAIPSLAVFVTVAVSIQNVPEGLAVAIPLHSYGVPNWKLFGWAVFTSLPQPVGAGIAYAFVTVAREFLPVGFGFAAGAMIYLVLHDLFPEALERGADLSGGGRRELAFGVVLGVAIMLPVLLLTG